MSCRLGPVESKWFLWCPEHGVFWGKTWNGTCMQCGYQTNMTEPKSFDRFAKEVLAQLESAARDKGYNETGAEGSNALYELVLSAVPHSGHAVGEIIYKAVRYARRDNPDDLVKAAAWAFLAWRYHTEDEAKRERCTCRACMPDIGTQVLAQ